MYNTLTRTDIREHKTLTYMYTHADTCMQADTHPDIHIQLHAHPHGYILTCLRSYTPAYMHTHTHVYAYTH